MMEMMRKMQEEQVRPVWAGALAAFIRHAVKRVAARGALQARASVWLHMQAGVEQVVPSSLYALAANQPTAAEEEG